MRRAPIWVILVTVLVYVFLHLPLLVLVVFSFNDSKYVDWKGFTWKWYARLFERDEITELYKRQDIHDALWNSLIVGFGSTIISTILGTLIALGLARYKFRGRTFIESLLYVPIVTPEIVVGISLLILFISAGVKLGISTILIAHVAFNISFVVIVVRARLEGMDRSLQEASLILGADEWTTFWRITVPQLWPGIISGALLAFIMSFDDFVITSLVSGPGSATLPMVVYGMARKGIEPTINAISTLILLATSILIGFMDWLERRNK